MTESYELQVLFTEEERNTYADWGIKKEKVLIPFAIATILIYVMTAAFVVMKVWGVRDSDHVLFQMLVLGDWIPELTGVLAILMTILLPGPLNFILDKIWKKPAEPMTLIIEPEGTNVKIRKAQTDREENLKNRKMATETESYPLTQLFAFLNPEDNTICYQKKWYIIGENTIENIYPAKYRHPWMEENVKALLQTYFDMTPEEAENFGTMSNAQKILFLEEKGEVMGYGKSEE